MLSGQRVGKYVLGEQIARGGMAEVWAARVEGPGGFVKSLALKFILESFAGDAELERLFVNEARVAARLQHANLVSVFDFDRLAANQEPGGLARYYIAMERVDGHDLRRVLQVARHKGHRISAGTALHIAGEVLKGLRYVHEWREGWGQEPLGLVHRDVSPHNILIGIGGEVKLSDFGIAKATTQSLGTQSGMIRGKLAYASPEQLRSEPVDHRADQFGLGVTLWEMLADRRLFDGTSEMEIVGKVLRCDLPSLRERGIDPAVEQVVHRMLSARPGERFATTAEALSAVLAAPGYSADAADVAQLMRQLFAAPALAVPPTARMSLEDPPAVSGLAETSLLERGRGAPPAATDAESVAATREVPASRGEDSGRNTPESRADTLSPVTANAIPARIDPSEAVTGSAYVSDHSLSVPEYLRGNRVASRARRVILALTLVAIAVLVGSAVITQPEGRSTSSAGTRSRELPRQSGSGVASTAAVPQTPDVRRPTMSPRQVPSREEPRSTAPERTVLGQPMRDEEPSLSFEQPPAPSSPRGLAKRRPGARRGRLLAVPGDWSGGGDAPSSAAAPRAAGANREGPAVPAASRSKDIVPNGAPILE